MSPIFMHFWSSLTRFRIVTKQEPIASAAELDGLKASCHLEPPPDLQLQRDHNCNDTVRPSNLDTVCVKDGKQHHSQLIGTSIFAVLRFRSLPKATELNAVDQPHGVLLSCVYMEVAVIPKFPIVHCSLPPIGTYRVRVSIQ